MKKKCSTCETEKSLDDFSKNKKKKYGVNGICKSCHSEYRKKKYQENKEKEKAQVNFYRKSNLEKYTYSSMTQHQKNVKAGRTKPSNCAVCGEGIFVTKKDLEFNKDKYCSSVCQETTYNDFYDNSLNEFRKRAILKNLNFDLDKQFLIDLFETKQKRKCAITKVPIEIKGKKEKAVIYKSASLDRIDSNKGYVKTNVQWVMLGVNYMKMNFPEKDLHKALFLIKENYKPLK